VLKFNDEKIDSHRYECGRTGRRTGGISEERFPAKGQKRRSVREHRRAAASARTSGRGEDSGSERRRWPRARIRGSVQ